MLKNKNKLNINHIFVNKNLFKNESWKAKRS